MSSNPNLFVPRSVSRNKHSGHKDKPSKSAVRSSLTNYTNSQTKPPENKSNKTTESAEVDDEISIGKEQFLKHEDSDCVIIEDSETNDCLIVEQTATKGENDDCIIVSDSAAGDCVITRVEEDICVIKTEGFAKADSASSIRKQIQQSDQNSRFHPSESDLIRKTAAPQSHSQIERNPVTYIGNVQRVESAQPQLINVGPLSPNKYIPLYTRRKRPPDVESYTVPEINYSKQQKMERPQSRCRNSTKSVPAKSKYRLPKDRCCFPRQWEYTDLGLSKTSQTSCHRGVTFTVMSYNVLAQNLLEDNMHLYPHCSPHVLRWEYRRQCLKEEIGYLRPDIICLQEVYYRHFDGFFKPFLSQQGYEGMYLQKSNDKLDGCATFFKRHKFSLDDAIPVFYNNKNGGNLLDRDNVALIVKLKLRDHPQSSRRLVVSNTHILFNPKRGDIKLAQLMVLLAEMDKVCYKSSEWPDVYHPLIMCGDYNMLPQSDIYKFMRLGYLNYTDLIIRNMSLQENDCPPPTYLSKMVSEFFPKKMGINDDCKYMMEVLKRCGKNSDKNTDDEVDVENLDDSIVGHSGTGTVSHHLRLMSAYNHKLARYNFTEDEVSTHHSKAACNVDYIFYGVRSGMVCFDQEAGERGEVKTKDVEEGHLKLLGRYGLMTEHELARIGSLPNKHLGSDHLCLIAKFHMS